MVWSKLLRGVGRPFVFNDRAADATGGFTGGARLGMRAPKPSVGGLRGRTREGGGLGEIKPSAGGERSSDTSEVEGNRGKGPSEGDMGPGLERAEPKAGWRGP